MIFDSIYELLTTYIISPSVPYADLCAGLFSTGLCLWLVSLAFYPIKWLVDSFVTMWR